MASMTSVAAAAVPAAHGFLQSSVEASVRSCPSPARLVMGQGKVSSSAVSTSRRSAVARASASEQEVQVWNMAKNAAAAAAISLVLSASPVQAAESDAFLQFPDNEAGAASRTILSDAKKKSAESFDEAQRTGAETTGQAASAGQAPPAISQVDPTAEEASDLAIADLGEKKSNQLPGTENSIGQNPGIIDNIYNTFKSAGEGRDNNVPMKPF